MWKTIRTGDGILKFVIGIARISTRPVGGSYTSMMTCFSKDKMFAASRIQDTQCNWATRNRSSSAQGDFGVDLEEAEVEACPADVACDRQISLQAIN